MERRDWLRGAMAAMAVALCKTRTSRAADEAALFHVHQWQRDERNPVLPPGGGAFDVGCCMNPFVMVQGDEYLLFYAGADNRGVRRICLATCPKDDVTAWRRYNPGRDVYQYDTEWGLHSSGPQGERADYVNRNANIYGMAHRAVRLIHYLREDLLRGASSWEMFTFQRAPGFGFLAQDAPQRRSMNYWLYYYFNRHVGRWVLDIDGTSPYYEGTAVGRTLRGPLTPAVATLSDDGQRIFLMLANGSWTREVPCRVELRGFPAKRATGIVLSHSDPDGHPFLDRREELVRELPLSLDGQRLSTTIPPHAVVFLTFH